MAIAGNLVVKIGTDLRDLNRGLSQATSSTQRFGARVGNMARTAARGLSLVGTAAIGVGTAIVGMANKAADAADRIDKMSVRTGLSRDRLQELDFVTSQLGSSLESVETAVQAFARRLPMIERGVGDSATAFRRLGVPLRDTQGNLRSMSDLFPDVLKGLADMENETDRAVTATALFGRQSFQLVPLLKAGGDEIDRLSDRAHELGLVLGGEQLDNLVEYKDRMDALQKSLSATFTRLIADRADEIATAAENIAEGIKSLADALKDPLVQEFFGILKSRIADTKGVFSIEISKPTWWSNPPRWWGGRRSSTPNMMEEVVVTASRGDGGGGGGGGGGSGGGGSGGGGASEVASLNRILVNLPERLEVPEATLGSIRELGAGYAAAAQRVREYDEAQYRALVENAQPALDLILTGVDSLSAGFRRMFHDMVTGATEGISAMQLLAATVADSIASVVAAIKQQIVATLAAKAALSFIAGRPGAGLRSLGQAALVSASLSAFEGIISGGAQNLRTPPENGNINYRYAAPQVVPKVTVGIDELWVELERHSQTRGLGTLGG